jgi:hypothetical protein
MEKLAFTPLRTARPDGGNPRLVTENPVLTFKEGA